MKHKEAILKGFEDLKKHADSLPTKKERDKAYKIVAEALSATVMRKRLKSPQMHIYMRKETTP